MNSFRKVYDPITGEPCPIQVIGYRMPFEHIVSTPAGVNWTFIRLFYEKVSHRFPDGQVISLPLNSLTIVPRHTPIYWGLNGKWTGSWIRFDCVKLERILAESGIPADIPLCFKEHRMNEHFLLDLHRELCHPRGMIPGNIEDIFKVWLRNIKRECGTEEERDTIPDNFVQVRQFIESDYLKPLRLDAIAHRFGMSKSKLCQGFRKYFNTTPIEYQLKLKLKYAEELLSNVNLNITQVAELSGFSDIYYFSRIFSRHMHMPPGEYRKHYRLQA